MDFIVGGCFQYWNYTNNKHSQILPSPLANIHNTTHPTKTPLYTSYVHSYFRWTSRKGTGIPTLMLCFHVRGKNVLGHHVCNLMRWALFRILFGSFQALQKPLNVFLIQNSFLWAKDFGSEICSTLWIRNS